MAKTKIEAIQARYQFATNLTDAEFIAHARKDIPTLLKALDNEKSFRIAIQNQHEAFMQDVKKDVEEFGIKEHKLKLKLKDWKARAEKAEAALAGMEQQGGGVGNGGE